MPATVRSLTGADIVAAARKYLGAAYRPGGLLSFRCFDLVLQVAEDLGLVDVEGLPIRRSDVPAIVPVDPARQYDFQEFCALVMDAYSLDHGGCMFLGDVVRRRLVRRYLRSDPVRPPLEPGDVAHLRIPTLHGYASHGGILSEIDGDPSLIHLYATENDGDGVYGLFVPNRLRVVEIRFDEYWLKRLVSVFSFPGVGRAVCGPHRSEPLTPT